MRGSRNQFEPSRPHYEQERPDNTAPSTARTGSAGPLQRYFTTTSGARPGNFGPGLSFGTVLVSHDYLVVVELLGVFSIAVGVVLDVHL
jgi:hypothetical protein